MPLDSKKLSDGKFNILNKTVSFSSILHLMLAILLVWIAFISVAPIAVAGIQLFAVYFTGLGAVIFASCVFGGIKHTRISVITVCLIFSVCLLASFAKGWGFTDSVYGILLYSLPLFFFFIPSFVDLSLSKICFYVQLMTIAASFVSLLVLVGIIDSGIDGYNIAILKVDNTIGLIGLAVSFYLLNKEKSNKIFAWITVALSLFVVITGQSRARMIYAGIIIALFSIYMVFFAKKSRAKNVVVLVCAALVVIMFIVAYSAALENYLSFVIDKFGELGEDISTTYRMDEMKLHTELFMEHFWFGIGAGALNNEYTTAIGEKIYGHNMLTGLFAFEGVFYGIAFILVFLSVLVKSIYRFVKSRTPSSVLCAILMLLLTVLAITSGGFSKLATHAGALIVGIILNGAPVDGAQEE